MLNQSLIQMILNQMKPQFHLLMRISTKIGPSMTIQLPTETRFLPTLQIIREMKTLLHDEFASHLVHQSIARDSSNGNNLWQNKQLYLVHQPKSKKSTLLLFLWNPRVIWKPSPALTPNTGYPPSLKNMTRSYKMAPGHSVHFHQTGRQSKANG